MAVMAVIVMLAVVFIGNNNSNPYNYSVNYWNLCSSYIHLQVKQILFALSVL